ncbi:MAG TPA: prephenate dehydratase [Limnochordia bacterium]|nr:prephenate dehydratase [Limnochordia bacterium]
MNTPDPVELRVAFFGPAGTFTEEAARTHFAGAPVAFVAMREIGEVLQAVAAGQADRGVVPLENSQEGTVNAALDGLVHDVELSMVGEVILPIRHMLLGAKGAKTEAIRLVRSHPQALAQCRSTLARLVPQAALEAVTSTAWAAQSVQGDATLAAVAPRVAAELYGLTVLAESIQDSATNATRFAVVGREPAPPTGRDKTSIVFSFQGDRPGNLYEALGEFAQRDINLTKVESRPARLELGRYLFFADCEGHREDQVVAEALRALGRRCAKLTVLGSYPRAANG